MSKYRFEDGKLIERTVIYFGTLEEEEYRKALFILDDWTLGTDSYDEDEEKYVFIGSAEGQFPPLWHNDKVYHDLMEHLRQCEGCDHIEVEIRYYFG